MSIYKLQREFFRFILKPIKFFRPRNIRTLTKRIKYVFIIKQSGLFSTSFFSLEKKNLFRKIYAYIVNYEANKNQKKPMPGFHPGIYASKKILNGCEPFVHYIKGGKPRGEWSFPVITPNTVLRAFDNKINSALHLHVYYPELFQEIITRVINSKIRPDLFISVVNNDNRRVIENFLNDQYPGNFKIIITPNLGRDLGPFLTGFSSDIQKYEIIGHFHTKVSPHLSNRLIAFNWYKFLLENMIGGIAPMIDITLSTMYNNTRMGLVFADDPHIFGWMKNLEHAKDLAAKMGMQTALDESFNFPAGSMFWARTEALKPLFDLNLDWGDYPVEPIDHDGTMLHAIERLIPFVVRERGFDIAVTNVPGVTY